mmetsp:Transcript_24234/g.38779  ORF Transcript_24234/g.38779 Transcript_24234/m.38779 type:complete len:110 (-) Transcript_24234:326-655(-)
MLVSWCVQRCETIANSHSKRSSLLLVLVLEERSLSFPPLYHIGGSVVPNEASEASAIDSIGRCANYAKLFQDELQDRCQVNVERDGSDSYSEIQSRHDEYPLLSDSWVE